MKTAIRILTERDRELVIPYFESICNGCNNSLSTVDETKKWFYEHTKIGQIWFINDALGHLHLTYSYYPHEAYTIIDGVPEDFSFFNTKPLDAEMTKVLDDMLDERVVNLRYLCPCEIADEPCKPNCTCKHKGSSAGCSVCARYGSDEQRKNAANRIVNAIKSKSREQELEEMLKRSITIIEQVNNGSSKATYIQFVEEAKQLLNK